MAIRDSLKDKLAQCNDVEDYLAVAREAMAAPADADFAREILEEKEGECQFTKDFVAVAIAYKELLGEDAKADELLQQGTDFAMTGEEQMYVAEGQLKIKGDKAAAGKAYEAALKDISSTDELYTLASTIAKVIGNTDLVKKVYDKLLAKTQRAAEFSRLAKAAMNDLADKAYAASLFDKAAEKAGSSADLIALAAEVNASLGDADRAKSLYGKALADANDFKSLVSVLDAAGEDAAFASQVLGKAGEAAKETAEFLQLAQAYARVKDAAGVGRMLDAAENAVEGLEDMRKVVEASANLAASDTARAERVKAKLAKREANAARYAEFQNLEAGLQTVKQHIELAGRVKAELEDPFYAAKLLKSAEDKLGEEGGYQFGRVKPILLAVDSLLGDKAWVGRLLDDAAAKTTDFVWFRELVNTAARELSDKALGVASAKKYLEAWAAKLGDAAGVYDYTKLAELAGAAGDAGWAAKLLAQAQAKAQDHFAHAHIARIYRQLGQEAEAKGALTKAALACTDSGQCLQLVDRLKNYEFAEADVREAYEACGGVLKRPDDRLRWAEGVADMFGDRDWAAKAYDQIAGDFKSSDATARYRLSRSLRLGYRFFGPGVQAH
jgi:hypothetical protein